MKRICFLIVLSILFSCIPFKQSQLFNKAKALPVHQNLVPDAEEKRSRFEFQGKEFVIATDHPLASNAAISVWKLGGNVVDSFVAASFVISIVRPQSTGLLGGGFAILNLEKGKIRKAFDFRERAPIKATKQYYLNQDGTVIPNKTLVGAYSAGVPGNIIGFVSIQKKYGKLSLAQVLAPSIEIARTGFSVYPDLAKSIASSWNTLSPEMKIIFGKENRPLQEGENLIQNDVANVLERIALFGEKEIRDGETAQKIIDFYKGYDDFITQNDLTKYRMKEPDPIFGFAFGNRFMTMPPPSSGVHLITMFQVWSELQEKSSLPTGIVGENIRIIESMRVAYRDRAVFGGDPEFTNVDTNLFTSPGYAKEEGDSIEKKVVSGNWQKVPNIQKSESYNTTHISVLDRDGNSVSSTQSINGSLGAKMVVPGTGLVLNNTMDDFAVAPGVPNLYGLVGSKANEIAPGKTPLSSMSPLIFLGKDGSSEMAIGAPGGSQIPTTIFNTLFRYHVQGFALYDSASFPRIHHQYLPDTVFVEPELKGIFPENQMPFYQVQYVRHRAKVFVVAREGEKLIGVSDPRGDGIPLGF